MRNGVFPLLRRLAEAHAQVVEKLVPVVVELKKKQAERIGLAPEDMRIYDDVYSFGEGNPKPLGTPDDIMAAGKRMYEACGILYSNGLRAEEAK